MASHSSILAWRIPWTEEPGRLQSMGSQRVGHSWVTKQHKAVNSLIHNSFLRNNWNVRLCKISFYTVPCLFFFPIVTLPNVSLASSVLVVFSMAANLIQCEGYKLGWKFKVGSFWASLVVQWLRLHLPLQGAQLQPLVKELRFHMSYGQ